MVWKVSDKEKMSGPGHFKCYIMVDLCELNIRTDLFCQVTQAKCFVREWG